MTTRIPITFFFDQHQIVGSGVVNDDGTLTLTITTPEVIQKLMNSEPEQPALLALNFSARAGIRIPVDNE